MPGLIQITIRIKDPDNDPVSDYFKDVCLGPRINLLHLGDPDREAEVCRLWLTA